MLVLASKSPRRKALLAEAGMDFIVDPAAGEEEPWNGAIPPEEYVRRLAARKALEVAPRHPGARIVGADTIVVLDGRILGKPRDMENAREMLSMFSGREHMVFTGVALARDAALLCSWTTATAVRFKTLSGDEIREYLSLVNPLDKAGAYGIQDHGDLIVEGIRGSYSNVVGLPVEELLDALAAVQGQ